MKNVNDLNPTTSEKLIHSPQTQQGISLSALNDNRDSGININTTSGLSGVSEEKTNRPVVRVNPNRPNAPVRHRPISNDVKVVDPSTINETIPRPAAAPSMSPKDKAMGLLDQAVRRKKDEYKRFVAQATEDDAINRENVEAGLEDVNGEVQYMPVELQEDPEEPIINNSANADINEDDDLDSYDIDCDESYDECYDPSPSTIVDPFTVGDEYYDQYEDDNPNGPTDAEIDNVYDDENISSGLVDDDGETNYNEPFHADDDMYSNSADEETMEEDHECNYDENIDDSRYVEEIQQAEEEEEKPAEEEIEDEDDYNIGENAITIKNSALDDNIEGSSSDFDLDESDFEDVTTETDENLTDAEILEISNASEKHLKSEILQKIVMAGKKMNISQLNVSNKVINVKDALNKCSPVKARIGRWPLTFAGRPYEATALKGPEVALMSDSDNSDQNGIGLSMAQARIMFEHDANPYRPATLEAWAKTIPFADVDNIFAALYIASMKGANYIPMVCPKQSCQHAYLHDDIDIEKMVKFDTTEAEKNFNTIKSGKITADNTGSYESVISVINNEFAVGLKLPSIYTIMYEYNSLNQEFVTKYTAMVSIIQYIDYMYKIDEDTNSLQPIGWKTYSGDNTKTFKSKIATYAKILKHFDDTDFSVLMALINSMVAKAAEMKNVEFEVPECKCPKCGATIAARSINARAMVFMRQRLVELATTPTEK